MSPNRARPLLCYVTDRRALAGAAAGEAVPALLERIRLATSAGLDWIQIREKDLTGRALLDLTRGAVARAEGARVLVNDRLDVALAARAGGVHLGEASLPAADVVRWRRSSPEAFPPEFRIGVSCHSLEAAQAAERDAADYVIFGPVYQTPSKLAYGAPQGLERLAAVCRAVRIPVLAIGGITLENAAACLAAGAAGLAAIRLFQESPDLEAVVAALRSAHPAHAS